MSTYSSRAAVQSIMAIAESENSKPGRVTMPKVFLGVGIFDVIAMGVGIYFSLRFKEIIRAECCNAKEKIYTCLALKEELFPYKY